MTPQLLIFLAAVIYLGYMLVRHFKGRKQSDAPFIEVLEEQAPELPEKKQKQARKPRVADDDSEWRRRVRAEIEDMTK